MTKPRSVRVQLFIWLRVKGESAGTVYPTGAPLAIVTPIDYD